MKIKFFKIFGENLKDIIELQMQNSDYLQNFGKTHHISVGLIKFLLILLMKCIEFSL